MRFALFLTLNAILFLRPTELVSGLEELPLYEIVIVACLALSAGRIIALLSGPSLFARPTLVCVIGLFVATVLSHLARSNAYDAKQSGIQVAKLVAYFLVLLANVDTTARLDRTLKCLGLLTLCIATLSVLQFHGVIDSTVLGPYMERQDADADADGDAVVLARLRGVGIFADPNDICVILTIGAAACLYAFENKLAGYVRFAWLVPVGLFAYTISLTHSRGGLLAAVGAMLAYWIARNGVRRSGLFVAALLPLVLVAYGGRQTSFDTSSGTGQSRIQLWSAALGFLKEEPIFGIGHGEFVENVRHVTHNAFLQAYAELGLIGGSIFLGMFGYLLLTLLQLRGANRPANPMLLRVRPCILMMVVALVAGMMTLSRGYAVPTYLVAGLATVYLNLVARERPQLVPGINVTMAARLAVGSVAFLVVVYLFVATSVRWGS